MGVIAFMSSSPVDAPESSKSRTVALLNKTWSAIDGIVNAEFTGNRSAYFADLVTKDLARRGLTDAKVELQQLVDELAETQGIPAVRQKLMELTQLAALQEAAAS